MSFTWNCPACGTGLVVRAERLVCPRCSHIGLENTPNHVDPPNKKPAGGANGKKTKNTTSEQTDAPQPHLFTSKRKNP